MIPLLYTWNWVRCLFWGTTTYLTALFSVEDNRWQIRCFWINATIGSFLTTTPNEKLDGHDTEKDHIRSLKIALCVRVSNDRFRRIPKTNGGDYETRRSGGRTISRSRRITRRRRIRESASLDDFRFCLKDRATSKAEDSSVLDLNRWKELIPLD